MESILEAWIIAAEGLSSTCHRRRTETIMKEFLVAQEVHNRASLDRQRLLGNSPADAKVRPLPPKAARHKTRLAKMIASSTSPTAKADAEKTEVERWAKEARLLLIALELPGSPGMIDGRSLETQLRHCTANLRAKPLRSRVREAQKVHAWCIRTFQTPWLPSLEALEECLEERAMATDAGPTSLEPIYNAIRFIENIGQIDKDMKIATSEAAKKFKANLKQELGKKKPKTEIKKAPQFLLALLEALELTVMGKGPTMIRAMAWLRLVQHWTGLCGDDGANIDPGSLRIGVDGTLEAIAIITKTTGQGKNSLQGW